MEGSVFTADTTRREDSAITAKKAFIKIQQRTLPTEGSANVSNSCDISRVCVTGLLLFRSNSEVKKFILLNNFH